MPIWLAHIYAQDQKNKNTMDERERRLKAIDAQQRKAQKWGMASQGLGTIGNLAGTLAGMGAFSGGGEGMMGPPAPEARPSGGWLDPNSYMGE
jgi:hypothetical protein